MDWLSLVGILLLNMGSTAVGTLKTVFILRGISKPAYILTFLDALTFTLGMKMVVNGDGMAFAIVYAVGKTLWVVIGDILEKKIAFGVLDITIMAKRDKAILIADHLRSLDYSVSTRKVFGVGGEEKFDVCFVIQRKEYEFLKQTLEKLGFSNVSMVVTDVNKVTGKIRTQHTMEGSGQ